MQTMKVKKLIEMLTEMNPNSDVFTYIGSELGYKICPIVSIGRDEEKGNKCSFTLISTSFDGDGNHNWEPWEIEEEDNETNNKLIGGETMIGFNESSPITMQDAIQVVSNYLDHDGFDDYTKDVLTSLIQYLEKQ